MTTNLSDRLASRVQRSRELRQAQPPASLLHAVGFSAGLLIAGIAFLHGTQNPTNDLPSTPVVRPEPVLAVAPTASEPASPATEPVAAEPARCVPYASNGTYLPELCGEYDAFSDRAERALAE